jgi:hypothetical protein
VLNANRELAAILALRLKPPKMRVEDAVQEAMLVLENLILGRMIASSSCLLLPSAIICMRCLPRENSRVFKVGMAGRCDPHFDEQRMTDSCLSRKAWIQAS